LPYNFGGIPSPSAEVKTEDVSVPTGSVEMVTENQPVVTPPEVAPPSESVPPPVPEEPIETKVELTTETQPVPEPVPPEIPETPQLDEIGVTIEELHDVFKTDSSAADADYRGKMLKVKGLVEQVSVAEGDVNSFVVLGSANEAILRKVRCVFDKRYAPVVERIVVGQKITILGKYDGYDVNIRLIDCLPVG
jgi:hypothetical protein